MSTTNGSGDKEKEIKERRVPLASVGEYDILMDNYQYILRRSDGSGYTRYFSSLDVVAEYMIEEKIFAQLSQEENIAFTEAAKQIIAFRKEMRQTAEEIFAAYDTYINWRRGHDETPWHEYTGDKLK